MFELFVFHFFSFFKKKKKWQGGYRSPVVRSPVRFTKRTRVSTQMHFTFVDLPSGFSLAALNEHVLVTCHHQEYHVL